MKKLLLSAMILLAASSLVAQEKLPPATGQIPIVAWHGIPSDQMTVERFEELKEAGFTINSSSSANGDALQKALDNAQKAGVQLIIQLPELKSDPEATVKRFMNHPAVAGYYLKDEPRASDFEWLGEWARRIQAVDTKKFCYLNLFPTGPQEHFDALGVKDYRDYIVRFEREVPMPFLSFDHYPVTYDGLKPLWYENLEQFSDEARKAGKDFWAFAMATKHWMYPTPTLASIRLQMYSNLAYGAQGLQYFTYWTPRQADFDYTGGPIGLDGKRTEVFDMVKEMNTEIKALTPVFLGAEVIDVRHTGETIPKGTRRLDMLPEKVQVLDTHGSGAIVSQLQNGSEKYIVIVNRDYENPMQLTFAADASMKRVLKDGTIVPANSYTATMTVLPGDVVIYMY